ncbi:MAG: tetratricopeptide repeat protein, partial [Planctomycetota bacterium]
MSIRLQYCWVFVLTLSSCLWFGGKKEEPEGFSHADAALRLQESPVIDLGGVESHFSQANAYYMGGALEDAVEGYGKVIRFDPRHEEAHYNLGIAYDRMGRVEDAIKEWTTTLEINPLRVDALLALGLAYKEKGELGEASKFLTKALNISPQDGLLQYHMGEVLFAEGRYREALEAFNSVLQLNNAMVDARFGASVCMAELGRLEEALTE